MKKLILTLATLVGIQAQATVDGLTEVALVAFDYNQEEYIVRVYPTEGCYGTLHGPAAAVFGSEFVVTVGMGCGMPGQPSNVNALSCAQVEYDWDESYDNVKKVKANIAKCDTMEMENHDEKFAKAIREAAQKNFGEKVQVEVFRK